MDKQPPQDLPILSFECLPLAEDPSQCKLTWDWQPGVDHYEVRWKRTSETGSYAWDTAIPISNEFTAPVGAVPHDIELIAYGTWDEVGKQRIRYTTQAPG